MADYSVWWFDTSEATFDQIPFLALIIEVNVFFAIGLIGNIAFASKAPRQKSESQGMPSTVDL